MGAPPPVLIALSVSICIHPWRVFSRCSLCPRSLAVSCHDRKPLIQNDLPRGGKEFRRKSFTHFCVELTQHNENDDPCSNEVQMHAKTREFANLSKSVSHCPAIAQVPTCKLFAYRVGGQRVVEIARPTSARSRVQISNQQSSFSNAPERFSAPNPEKRSPPGRGETERHRSRAPRCPDAFFLAIPPRIICNSLPGMPLNAATGQSHFGA